MASPSRPSGFKTYGIPKPYFCSGGCGRKLTLAEPLWFVDAKTPGVFGQECFSKAAVWGVALRPAERPTRPVEADAA